MLTCHNRRITIASTMKPIFLIPLALIFFLPTVSAEVYKCKTPDGKTEYKNFPCDQAPTADMKPSASSFGYIDDRIRIYHTKYEMYQGMQQSTLRKLGEYIHGAEAYSSDRFNSLLSTLLDEQEWMDFCECMYNTLVEAKKAGYTSVDESKFEGDCKVIAMNERQARIARAASRQLFSAPPSSPTEYRTPPSSSYRRPAPSYQLDDSPAYQAPSVPRNITHCNDAFCYDDQGGVYSKGGGGALIRNDGKVCTGSGMLNCN